MGERAERAVRRRARLGAHRGRAAARGTRLGAAGVAARLARPDVPLPRRNDSARGRQARAGAHVAGPRRGAQSALLAALRPPSREGAAMRRALLAGLVFMAFSAAAAEAHLLGNFTINHLSRVSIGAQRIDVAYTLDQAEIPTFQESGRRPDAVLATKLAEARRGLHLTVDGRRVPLTVEPGARISFPEGQGGLRTTRVEARLTAPAGKSVRFDDATFPGRVGWKAVVVAPGAGTDVRSTVSATDPTDGL